MRQQAVEQRPRPVACGGVDDQSGGFVDDDDGIVFVHNIQIHRFRFECKILFARTYRYADGFPAYHFVFGLGGLIVYNDHAFFNPRCQAAARIIRHELCQHRIQPPARKLQRNSQINTTFCFGG